jgi:hypothetical protein
MALHINDDSMSLEINGAAVKAAVCLDNLWRVTGWPRLLTRNEAITALVLAERLLAGHGDDDPFVAAGRSCPDDGPAHQDHYGSGRGRRRRRGGGHLQPSRL